MDVIKKFTKSKKKNWGGGGIGGGGQFGLGGFGLGSHGGCE